jgi:hypothetical protein
MSPLQMGLGSLVGAVVFGLVPLVVLLIVIYRLAQIAENTDRMADALEYMARTQRTAETGSTRANAAGRQTVTSDRQTDDSDRQTDGDNE